MKSDTLPTQRVADIVKSKTATIYGRSGTGKSTLAATWPKPILYVDVRDQGTDSISDVEDIDVYEINSSDDLERLRLWLMKNKKKYATIVFDTMSQLQEVLVEEVWRDKGNQKYQPGEWGSMTKQDWGTVASIMKAFIIEMRDLPMETVFIAQDRAFNIDDEESDAGELTPEIGPRLMPSVVSILNAASNVIGCTFIRRQVVTKKIKGTSKREKVIRTEYCLRLGPSPVFVTKIRKPKSIELPDFLVDPEYDDIIDIIEGVYEA